MPTDFPTELDDFTNPKATDKMDVVPHASQHANINDATEALELKVGIDNSEDTDSIDYKLSHLKTTPIDSTDSPYTALITDQYIRVDCTGGPVTINLFTSIGNSGRVLETKKVDSSANAMTLDGFASQTIDDSTTVSTITPKLSFTIIATNSNWDIK